MSARILSGIYRIRNTVNGKVYVGSAVNVSNRWRAHKRELNKGTHHCSYLQHAWIKHGEIAFVFEVVEAVQRKQDLILTEQAYIDSLSSADRLHGYNVAPRAGSTLGLGHSPEARKRMAAAQTGRKHSAESRAQRAVALTGRAKSETHRASLVAAWKTRAPASAETREKMRANMRGNANLAGHKHSEETRAKMSAWQKLRAPASAESLAKRSESLKAYHARRKAGNAITASGVRNSGKVA